MKRLLVADALFSSSFHEQINDFFRWMLSIFHKREQRLTKRTNANICAMFKQDFDAFLMPATSSHRESRLACYIINRINTCPSFKQKSKNARIALERCGHQKSPAVFVSEVGISTLI